MKIPALISNISSWTFRSFFGRRRTEGEGRSVGLNSFTTFYAQIFQLPHTCIKTLQVSWNKWIHIFRLLQDKEDQDSSKISFFSKSNFANAASSVTNLRRRWYILLLFNHRVKEVSKSQWCRCVCVQYLGKSHLIARVLNVVVVMEWLLPLSALFSLSYHMAGTINAIDRNFLDEANCAANNSGYHCPISLH